MTIKRESIEERYKRYQKLQSDYKNLHGRSVILDCVAVDGMDRQINIELQQDNEGASAKRASRMTVSWESLCMI